MYNPLEGTEIPREKKRWSFCEDCKQKYESALAEKEKQRAQSSEDYHTTRHALEEREKECEKLKILFDMLDTNLYESLSGTRMDSSWIRPMQLSMKERQSLYLDCQKIIKQALEGEKK